MLEIPEAICVSKQLNSTIKGKTINHVIVARSPHKFAWFSGDTEAYCLLLNGKSVGEAKPYGGRVEIAVEHAVLHFGDGVNLRYYNESEKKPDKHQLFVAFDDGSALAATVAMYGGMWCFQEGTFDNAYYRAAKESVSPLSDAFDFDYFLRLLNEKSLKLSAKAFLATEQRIPGLGNGVLHDILLNANVHPKAKMNGLTDVALKSLFDSVKFTLREMTDCGGRDTERDLFGNSGGYKTKLSKNNSLLICPNCSGAVKKENYLGGSIYYCIECQKL